MKKNLYILLCVVFAALSPATHAQIITTIAGTGTAGFSGDGFAATAAALSSPAGVFIDGASNMYIADFANHRIRKISPSGIITTICGTGTPGYSGDGFAATTATIRNPTSVVLDAAGNIFFCDYLNQCIRKINTAGIISTVAGTGGVIGFFGDGGPATAAKFNGPEGLCLDAAGNFYVADANNQRIRKVNTAGIITTCAGNGIAGYTADGIPATNSSINYPYGILMDAAGNLLIADQVNNRIRKVNTAGIISTIAGAGLSTTPGYSGDGGPATAAYLYYPNYLFLDGAGNNLYFSDRRNNVIRKIDASGIITTVAGTGAAGFFGDGGPATAALANWPQGVVVDNVGNLIFSDYNNNRVRSVGSLNTAPVFSNGHNQGLSLCENSGAFAISSTLAVVDTNSFQTLTWVAHQAPRHGALTGLPASAPTTGSTAAIVPGSISYTPNTGYFGPDSFKIWVNDGVSVDSTTFIITINENDGGKITGPSTVCPGNTILLSNSLSGGSWSSSNPSVATVSGGVVTGIAIGHAIISYTVSTSCGASTATTLITVGGPTISTFAGTGVSGSGAEGFQATATAMSTPVHTAIDALGNIYYSDYLTSRIRKINTLGVVSNYAGNGVSAYSGDGGPAISASLRNPAGIATDAAGNLYIADFQGYEIRKVDVSGIITTIAGTGASGSGSDGIPATSCAVNHCWGVLADAAGNVYFSDRYNHVIRKVNTAGIISTIAGTPLVSGYSGDGGPATAAKLNEPLDLLFNADGDLVFTEGANNIVRKISPNGIISTVAGNGTPGFGGDGGPATASTVQFNVPVGLAIDRAGDMYVGDFTNNRVRMISTGGIITTIAGTGTSGYNGDNRAATAASLKLPQGVAVYNDNIYICDANNFRIRLISPTDAVVAPISGTPVLCQGVPVMFTDATAGGTWTSNNTAIATVGSLSGVVTGVGTGGVATISYTVPFACGSVTRTFAITLVQSFTAGAISGPSTVCPGNSITLTDAASGGTWTSTDPAVATVTGGLVTGIAAGNAVISYTITNGCGTLAARQMITVGDPIVTTIAGNGIFGYTGDGGPATAAQLRQAVGIAKDASGNTYFCDYASHVIRMISPSGIITTVAGNGVSGYSGDGGLATNAKLTNPSGLAVDPSGNVLWTEYGNHVIRKLDVTSHIISTVSGNGTAGFAGDGGLAVTGRFNHPASLFIEPSGTIFVSDASNQRVRKISTAGILSTVAGTDIAGYSGEGIQATASKLNNPFGICTDAAGNLYIADQSNYRIRKVDVFGFISTIAGSGLVGYIGDNGPATAAALNIPTDIKIDAAGNFLIADRLNNVVRKVNGATGIITTIAGTSTAAYAGDGGAPATAQFNNVPFIYLDAASNLYISDFNNSRIRKVAPIAQSVSAITGASTVCVGASTPLADITVGGVWSSDNLAVATVGSAGVVTGLGGGVANITYAVGYACGLLYSVHPVTVVPTPAVPPAISGPTTVCLGSSVTLTDATAGGTWTSSVSAIATIGSSSGTLTPVSAGITTIDYTIANACGTNTVSRFDTVVSTPGPITGVPSLCVGSTSLLSNAVPSGVWTSSNSVIASVGSGSGLVSGITPGTAVISYTVGGSCTANLVVTVNTLPAAITPSGAVTVCAGATTTLADPTPGGSWSSGGTAIATVGTSGIVTGVSAGSVAISYASGAGCYAIKTVTVLAAPAALSPVAATVCTGSSVTFTNSVSGGTWSSLAPGVASISGGVVTGVAAGTTSISYTVGSCSVGAPVTVSATPAAITPGAVAICVGATASLADGTPGGVWSSASSSIASVGTSGVVTGASAGTVNISYTTAGCAAVRTVTVLTTPAALSPASATVCTGNTVTLAESVTGGVWSSNLPGVANVAGGIVTGVTAGTATISYTIGTCFVTAPVTVNLSPGAGAISGPSLVCTGSPATYTDAAPGGVWSSSNPAVLAIGTSGTATAMAAGSATISYSVSGSCGTVYATLPVSVLVAASAGTVVGAAAVCAGTYTTYTDAVPGGVWSVTNSHATISGAGLLVGVSLGIDTVLYSVTNACGTVSSRLVVTIGAFASAGTISGPSTVCAGSAVTLTDPVSGGAWSTSNGSASVAGGVVTGLTAGVDTIYYTLTASCGVVVTSKVITVVPIPDAGTIAGPVIMCAGSVITYTVSGTGGVWGVTNPLAAISGAGILTALTPGNDSVTYTVSNVCGTSIAYHAITIGTGISAGAITGPASVCEAASITLTDPATGGVWSATNAHASVSGGVVTGVTAGVDTIYYTVTSSCGSVNAVFVVVVNPLPAAGTITGPSSLCMSSAPAAYTDPAVGGTWSVTNSSASITSGGVVTPLSAGTDTIRYTVTNGCGSAVATQVVNIVITPVAGTITGPSNICVGTTVTLTDAVPGGTWSASNANATVSGGMVSGITSGLDTIAYTVSTGCGTAVATKVVDVNVAPSPGIILGSPDVCLGSVIILTDPVSGGAWSASNPAATITTSGAVTGITPGVDTISYTVTNVCGSFAATHMVTVTTAPPSVGVITGPSVVCSGASITLADAVPGGVWSASNAAATVSAGLVTGITPGADTITYTITNGCGTSAASVVITVGASLSAGVITGPSSVCAGGSASLTDPVTGGVWSASNSSATVSGGMVTGIAAGVDTISYAVSGGCGTVVATHIVTVSIAPAAGTITGATGVCAGSSTVLTSTAPGGIWSASNARATVSSVGLVTGITSGLDTIRYSVSNGCGTAVASWPFSVLGSPSAGSIAGGASTCPGHTIALSAGVSGGAWSSSAVGIATVSSSGVVTGVASGSATISYTVTNSCGHTSAVHAVAVLSPAACTTLAVNTTAGIEDALKVAPNPNDGAFTVSLVSDRDEPVQIIITNVLGEKVKEINTTTNKVVDLQMGEAAGIYLLSAYTAHGRHVARVVIN